MSEEAKSDPVRIEQRVDAPAPVVAAYVGDFRNAEAWMAGVSGVEKLSEDSYRLTLDGPVGKLQPEVRVLEHDTERFRWEYTSVIEGGGEVTISPEGEGACVVSYVGEFRFGGALMDRASRFVRVDRFARKNGERSLACLKDLMESGRYGA